MFPVSKKAPTPDESEAAFHQWRDGLIQYMERQRAPVNPAEATQHRKFFKEALGSSRFDYDGLDVSKREIRLLYIENTDNFDAPLKASLRIKSLNDRPHYDCLSYVWGSGEFDCTIEINGRLLEITANLEQALRRYRALAGFHVIWVDAICIDQNDLEERKNQVGIMQHIYATAAIVYAYIGEPRPDGPSLDALRLLAEPRDTLSSEDLRKWLAAKNTALQDRGEAVIELLSRPWFTRAWITQEATLNLNVVLIFGDITFGLGATLLFSSPHEYANIVGRNTEPALRNILSDSARALFLMSKLSRSISSRNPKLRSQSLEQQIEGLIAVSQEIPSPKTQINFTEDGIQAFVEGEPKVDVLSPSVIASLHEIEVKTEPISYRLVDLLHDFRFTNATDPRDKIYALLGLASDIEDCPAIDYTKPAEEVYRDFAIYLICKGQGLDVLRTAAVCPRNESSWVPTWSVDQMRREPFDFFSSYCGFKASGSLSPVVYFDDTSSRSCSVQGRIIDRIATLCDKTVMDAYADGNPFWQYLSKPLELFGQGVMAIGRKVPIRKPGGGFLWIDWPEAIAQDTLSAVPESGRLNLYSSITATMSRLLSIKYGYFYKGRQPSVQEEASAWADQCTKDGRTEDLGLDPVSIMIKHLWDTKTLVAGYMDMEMRKKIPFRRTIQRLLHGRRIAITWKGYLGLVPDTAKEGDVIAMFAGAELLFVLRKVLGDEDRYLLKGDAYLRGFMNGEAVRDKGLNYIQLV